MSANTQVISKLATLAAGVAVVLTAPNALAAAVEAVSPKADLIPRQRDAARR